MKISGLGKIDDFCKIHSQAKKPLFSWKKIIEATSYKNIQELKTSFNSVDYIGNDQHCFDISGNKFRLIAIVVFIENKLIIDQIMTHAEYDN